jgi:putrescine aminotransferase
MDFPERIAAIARYANGPYVEFLRRLGLDREFVRAQGASVWDRDGREYVDCVAGYGNLNVGHNHPKVIEAVTAELRSPRPFNLPFLSDAQARLYETLARVTPGDLECSFVVNSGSEALDTALKLARLATGKPHLVATRGAWHGFTFGALSIAEPSMVRGFGPLLGDVTHVPFGDADAVAGAIAEHTAAVVVEPILSESGAVVPRDGYLRALAEICEQRGVLLVFDEVKTGVAKTGRMFACEHDGAVPDVICTGKALGGGAMPIGAVTARRKLWGKFGLSFPMSSSSGAGNAPACAAALATLEVVESEGLAARAARAGDRLLAAAQKLAAANPAVLRGASGRGLLVALHTVGLKAASDLIVRCVQEGVLVMAAFCDRTRVLIEPPLCVSDPQLDRVLAALTAAVAAAQR